jgi:outer membrane protein
MSIKRFYAIVVVSVLFVVNVMGQTEQGKVLIGGDTRLNFSSLSQKMENDDNSVEVGKAMNIEVYPQIGYFVTDGLALGAEIPIMYTTEEDINDIKQSTFSIALAPFLRYYIGVDKVRPYIHGSVGFGKTKYKLDYENGQTNDANAGLFMYEIGGGLGIFLTDKVSLDFSIGYTSVAMNLEEFYEEDVKQVTSGLGVGIGISIML